LPFALGHPRDAARVALVAKPWAADVRRCFERDSTPFMKGFGLAEHFTTPAQAAAALSILKAIQRPSPELRGHGGGVQ
jgi:hypothetical protein